MIQTSEREEVSDQALMLRYQRGDRSAFVTLLRRYQVAVYNFVLRQLGSALSADEIAREVFLGVVREAPRFDYETPFSTRLFAIAHQLVRDERQRMPSRQLLQRGPSAPESSRAGAGSSSRLRGEAALEDSIVSAVEALPDDQKDVFLLREVADLSFSEIATVTRQSETAVKIQMQHALQRLRLALQDFDEYRRALR
ncbi:MAG TPA: sigma-70 family RNA polymerase sigma factor [Polyangiaceae bacterium]|jgi:RNA polymerase sigma-70 factor (ECF subfamily)|nr:sigma-70 family RNA polymerase sigma factor [Polyangiaceae bacterium]